MGMMAWKSGQSYSADLRSRVLAAVDGGIPARAVAARFQVSVSYIYKALGRRSTTGETEARPQRNHQELKLAAHHQAIAAEVARRPDVTLDELRAWLLASHDTYSRCHFVSRLAGTASPALFSSASSDSSHLGRFVLPAMDVENVTVRSSSTFVLVSLKRIAAVATTRFSADSDVGVGRAAGAACVEAATGTPAAPVATLAVA